MHSHVSLRAQWTQILISEEFNKFIQTHQDNGDQRRLTFGFFESYIFFSVSVALIQCINILSSTANAKSVLPAKGEGKKRKNI